MLVRVVQKVTLPVIHPMAPANWLWREKERGLGILRASDGIM